MVHAGTAFSQAQIETPAESVAEVLLAAFFVAIQQSPRPAYALSAHRWLYALAQPPLYLGALVDADRQIALGGDWCHGSRIEGAWLSGLALAEQARYWVSLTP